MDGLIWWLAQQGWFVQKPINANPWLKVNRGLYLIR